jgi:hypothetical protein
MAGRLWAARHGWHLLKEKKMYKLTWLTQKSVWCKTYVSMPDASDILDVDKKERTLFVPDELVSYLATKSSLDITDLLDPHFFVYETGHLLHFTDMNYDQFSDKIGVDWPYVSDSKLRATVLAYRVAAGKNVVERQSDGLICKDEERHLNADREKRIRLEASEMIEDIAKLWPASNVRD